MFYSTFGKMIIDKIFVKDFQGKIFKFLATLMTISASITTSVRRYHVYFINDFLVDNIIDLSTIKLEAIYKNKQVINSVIN